MSRPNDHFILPLKYEALYAETEGKKTRVTAGDPQAWSLELENETLLRNQTDKTYLIVTKFRATAISELYVSPRASTDQLREILNATRRISSSEAIIMGDINARYKN